MNEPQLSAETSCTCPACGKKQRFVVMTDILQKKTEELAIKEAQNHELQVFAWIKKHGVKKLFFNRWIFIWCDMNNFKFKD